MYEIFEKLMKTQDATHYRVAKESGVDQATLSRWKNGKGDPSLETLQILADYFGVSLDHMRGRENRPHVEQEKAPAQGEDSVDVMVEDILASLTDNDGDTLMLDGNLANPKALEYLRDSIRANIEYAKKLNREEAQQGGVSD